MDTFIDIILKEVLLPSAIFIVVVGPFLYVLVSAANHHAKKRNNPRKR